MPAPACEQRALCRQYGRTHAGATRRDERHTIVDHGGAAAGLAEVSDQTRTRRIRRASAGFEEHSNDRGGEFWPGAVTSNPYGEKAQSAVLNHAARLVPFILRDAAEPVIGPRYARTWWRLVRMRSHARSQRVRNIRATTAHHHRLRGRASAWRCRRLRNHRLPPERAPAASACRRPVS